MDEKIRTNLADAGCSREFIEEFDTLCNCARICRLKEHRRELLQGIHAEQKKLECLDYLIYQLRTGTEENTKETS